MIWQDNQGGTSAFCVAKMHFNIYCYISISCRKMGTVHIQLQRHRMASSTTLICSSEVQTGRLCTGFCCCDAHQSRPACALAHPPALARLTGAGALGFVAATRVRSSDAPSSNRSACKLFQDLLAQQGPMLTRLLDIRPARRLIPVGDITCLTISSGKLRQFEVHLPARVRSTFLNPGKDL